MVVAGTVLLLIALIGSRRIRPTRAELSVLIPSGVLMWVGGNGAVNWAEQQVDSGLVALIIGTMPMWVAFAESILEKRRPSLFLMGAVSTGFVGLMLLIAPMFHQGLRGDLPAVLVVIGGTVCWGAGSLLISRRPLALGATATVSQTTSIPTRMASWTT